MKYSTLAIGIFLSGIYTADAQINASTNQPLAAGDKNWSLKSPFISEVFIENNGQFNNPGGQPLNNVRYAIINGGMKVYFTSSGLSYQVPNVQLNPQYEKEKEEIREKAERQIEKNGKTDESFKKYFTDKSAYVNMEWEGANPDAAIVVSDKVPDNYSYITKNEKGENASVLANAFKKITYKNIYPKIDIEYYFPANSHCLGVEYNIVVHPGGDLALVKMKYSGMETISMDRHGNIMVMIPDGIITDHAPGFSFVGSEANKTEAKFILNGQTVSFDVPQYDKTQQLIIDPFTTIWNISPGFTTANAGYTIRTDYYHNVFVMGGGVNMGGFPFTRWDYQVKKFDPSGVLQWTAIVSSPNSGAYGDMVVLRSGKAIVGHAFGAPGAVSLLDPATGAITSRPTTGANEPGWRFSYNQAANNNILFIGGGSNNGAHLYKTDTNITAVSLNNPWASPVNTEDIAYIAQDKAGAFVYATNATNSSPNSSTTAPKFIKASTATPGTAIWKVNEPTNMRELGQGSFLNGGIASFFGAWATGVNGMVVCNNRIYTYDGVHLRAYDTANGLITDSANTGGALDKYSGIDVDNCCRVYVGVNGVVKRYSSALVYETSIPTTSDVYDLKIDPLNDTIMYVTGKGFVESLGIGSCFAGLPPVAVFTSSDTIVCSEAGKCISFFDHSTGNPTSWQWIFAGATPSTSTAQNPTNICYYYAGTYPVTLIVSNGNGSDTLDVSPLIVLTTNPVIPTVTLSGKTLCSSNSATYQWYFNGAPIPGATSKCYTATQTGTYSVLAKDSIGCSALSNGQYVNVTSVNELIGESFISIYPNPVSGEMTILFSAPLKQNTDAVISDVLGKELGHAIIEKAKSTYSIRMDDYANGIYLLQLRSGDQTVNRKFVVVH